MARYRTGGYRRFLKKNFKVKLKKQTFYSIASLFFLGLAFFVILSFSQRGILLIRLNQFLTGLFGWGIYFLPFLLVVCGLMLTKFRTPVNRANVLLGLIFFLISLLGLAKEGILGSWLWFSLAAWITGIGAGLIFLIGFLVGLVVFFDTSFDQIILNAGEIFKKAKSYLIKPRKEKPKYVQEKMPLRNELKPIAIQKEPSRSATNRSSAQTEILPPTTVNLPGSQSKIWNYPPLSLLSDRFGGEADRGDVKFNAQTIEKTLDSFGITAHVLEINKGPAVTQYALEVALGTKLSKITVLSNNLALSLAAPTGQIRIEAPIPGRSLVGIELPNRSLQFVTLKEMLSSDEFKNAKSKLSMPLGLDVSGNPVVANLAKMPHVLIAGQTNSGKSVLLNSWIASILFRTTPNEVRLILVDPKRVELTQYSNIPHLLLPVIVEPEKVVHALMGAMQEMDNRYKKFAEVGARNIDTYNEMSGFQALPYIVIVIDELADIILFAPAQVEDCICRLAQMARATGIHLVISTQHPSVDVLTGLIKANFPTRISFAVASMVDSRVILDTPGAEKLLGRGDMLYTPPDQAKPTRVQGAYVSDPEITRLIDFIRKSGVTPQYAEEMLSKPVSLSSRGMAGEGGNDAFFEEAVKIVCQYERASASLLQRRLSIGYSRAARILDQLEAAGIVGPAEASKPREVLARGENQLEQPLAGE